MGLSVPGAVVGLVGILLIGVAVVAYRRRDAPGAGVFAVVAGIAGEGALAVAISAALDMPWAVTLAAVLAVGLLLPVPWLLFCFEYTGRGELVTTRVGAVIAAPAVAGLLATGIVFGSQLIPGLRLPAREVATGLDAVAITVLTTSQWLFLLYAGGLMLVGSGVLLWSFERYEYLDSTTGTLLGVFGVVPWLSLLLGLQVEGTAPGALLATIAVGFGFGGVAAAGLVGPYDLFSTVPAASNVGPATVFEELNDIVVVTDDEASVVEINHAAEHRLDVSPAEVVGGDVRDLFDAGPQALRQRETVALRSNVGRAIFEPTVSELTDQHGRPLGYAIVLRDVTARTTRQQQLEVFNRVLRHNLGNDMSVVLNHAELLERRIEDPELAESAAAIVGASDDLLGVSETVQTVGSILDTDASTTIQLAPLIDEVLAAVRTDREVDCERELPPDLTVEGSRERLELALVNLVENAIEHNESERPSVEIRAAYDQHRAYPVTITVADDGPGIPAAERRAIDRGSETPLQHGSGLGLWLARWAVTKMGGEIEFDDREPRGTVVSIHLPQTTRTDLRAEQPPPRPER